jgi:tRNA(Ile2) C34 agmatinyltransferase TiaS
MKLLTMGTLSLLVVLVATPVFAHHGGSAYDNSKATTLTGTVTDFQFIQPHPIIALDVKDDKGEIVKWSVEMTSPNHLVRFGWNGHKLKPGDEITVVGSAAKNGLKVLNLRKISYATGQLIPLGPPPEANNNN